MECNHSLLNTQIRVPTLVIYRLRDIETVAIATPHQINTSLSHRDALEYKGTTIFRAGCLFCSFRKAYILEILTTLACVGM